MKVGELTMYQKEILTVRELFKNDKDYLELLTDEHILKIIDSIEKWRKDSLSDSSSKSWILNSHLENLRVSRNKDYWIAYQLLSEEERKSLESYQYRSIVQDFIDTKVRKAKESNTLNECCESLLRHRITENKIFKELILDSKDFTEEEKQKILDCRTFSEKTDLLEVKGTNKNFNPELPYSGAFSDYLFVQTVVEIQRETHTLNEVLEEYRVNLHFQEADGEDACTWLNSDFKTACCLLTDEELNQYVEFAYKKYIDDFLTALKFNKDDSEKKIKHIKEHLENENELFVKIFGYAKGGSN